MEGSRDGSQFEEQKRQERGKKIIARKKIIGKEGRRKEGRRKEGIPKENTREENTREEGHFSQTTDWLEESRVSDLEEAPGDRYENCQRFAGQLSKEIIEQLTQENQSGETR
ncbi:MAG TPA: hypothetical protein VMS12_09675 [Thermoanaerobaculia bacterium]|nr:hypothetical protein [Thermoanaerobaculia bacterium]